MIWLFSKKKYQKAFVESYGIIDERSAAKQNLKCNAAIFVPISLVAMVSSLKTPDSQELICIANDRSHL